MPADFASIVAHTGSQRTSFEELVCQMLRRNEATGNDSWRRFEGAGGDGGVEARWITAAGVLTGVQAKYFTSSGAVDWSQIKKSFQTALAVHADLGEYRIYLACDLTGATKRKVQAGFDKWAACKKAMNADAAALGRTVAIKLITASEIFSELVRPQCVGLRAYWMGEIEITREKLTHWFDLAQAALGERYHAEDHVNVSSMRITRALARGQAHRNDAQAAFQTLAEGETLSAPYAWRSAQEKLDLVAAINSQRKRVVRWIADAPAEADKPWPLKEWSAELSALSDQVRQVLTWCHDDSTDNVRSLRGEAYALDTAIEEAERSLKSYAARAREARAAVFLGEAGAGKSHMFAASVREILDEAGVAVLLLGHRFQRGDVWSQIAEQLGMPGVGRDELLGALDAAAAQSRSRGVIFVDALNEGPLRWTWLRELEPFVDAILKRTNLAVAVSCRDVFEGQVLSDALKARFSPLIVRGFRSEDELEAAAIAYMDRKGIVRPSAPWLSPEFTNPLFLRSCCVALSRAGEAQFPTGLRGAKQLLNFYLDAVARGLDPDWDGDVKLQTPCRKALEAIALRMATDGRDWISFAQAGELVAAAFAPAAPPAGSSWIAVLLRNGVLREDPDPEAADADDDNLIVRFAFQRFQDHLMAEALLERAERQEDLFAGPSALALLLNDKGNLKWEWSGLIEALSIQIPERFGVDLVDALPGGEERHWRSSDVQYAFYESIRWRDPGTIHERAFELANRFDQLNQSVIDLLIEVCARPDHPWNGDFLHQKLVKRPLAKRDQVWTWQISTEGADEGHPLQRLMQWCSGAGTAHADDKVLELCATVLSWSCSATSRVVRDVATKALAALLFSKPHLFPPLLAKFAAVDDFYVLERLLAAGYGVVVRKPDGDVLSAFATAVYDHIFAGRAPLHIGARDYARAIIDLAARLNVLDERVVLTRCRAPYGSQAPTFDVTEGALEKIAAEAGDDQIASSCTMGDFQHYEIETRFADVTLVPLSSPAPMSGRQRATAFEDAIRARSTALADDLEALRIACFNMTNRSAFWKISGEEDEPPEPTAAELADLEAHETRVRAQLDPSEEELLDQVWIPERLHIGARNHVEPRRVDAMEAGRWIAARAYGLGWTKDLFGKDLHRASDYSRDRPRLERIGKKYQWLARSELLARLLDNYWLSGRYDDIPPTQYAALTDIDFERDIDPTLFPVPPSSAGDDWGDQNGLMPATRDVALIEAADERLAWPFSDETAELAEARIRAAHSDGRPWLRLHWHSWVDRHFTDGGRRSGHDLAQREFYFINGALCPVGEGAKLVEALKQRGTVEIRDWSAREMTDAAYVYELGKTELTICERWRAFYRGDVDVRTCLSAIDYRWESHLDSALPEGENCTSLAGWMMDAEGLALDPHSPRVTRAADGAIVAWSSERGRGNTGLCVDAHWFEAVLARHGLECILVITGEREAWNRGDSMGARAHRRFNVLADLHGKRLAHWNEDHRPGRED